MARRLSLSNVSALKQLILGAKHLEAPPYLRAASQIGRALLPSYERFCVKYSAPWPPCEETSCALRQSEQVASLS